MLKENKERSRPPSKAGKPEKTTRNSLDNPRYAAGKTRDRALPLKADSRFGVVPPLSADRAGLPGDQTLVKRKGVQCSRLPEEQRPGSRPTLTVAPGALD